MKRPWRTMPWLPITIRSALVCSAMSRMAWCGLSLTVCTDIGRVVDSRSDSSRPSACRRAVAFASRVAIVDGVHEVDVIVRSGQLERSAARGERAPVLGDTDDDGAHGMVVSLG